MDTLLLYQGYNHALTIHFRELSGLDEMNICQRSGADNVNVSHLLQSLITTIECSGKSVDYHDLTLSAQDLCLAHFYISHYGHILPCQITCTACKSEFEFSLNIEEIRLALEDQAHDYGPDSENIYTSKTSGRQFRLPTITDLEKIKDVNPQDWLRSFLVSGNFDFNAFQIEIDEAGPLFSLDLKADCPECSVTNPVRFDLANYCLQTLRAELPFLVREIHMIARKYNWSLSEITGLNRTLRHQFAALITADTSTQRYTS